MSELDNFYHVLLIFIYQQLVLKQIQRVETEQFINWTKNKKLQFASYYISLANPRTEKFGMCMYSEFCHLTSEFEY